MNTVEKINGLLFTKMFGDDLEQRLNSFTSEYFEMVEAFMNYKKDTCPINKRKLINEVADVQSILSHITYLLEDTIDNQLTYTTEKLLSRIEISSYKGQELKK